MNKCCAICGHNIKDGEKVLVGMVTIYHVIPSRVAFAVEPSNDFLFANHFDCELEIDDQIMEFPPEEEDNERN